MSHHGLITEFTEHYMEKLFYFCLKRTGSSDEAENLTQDIALNIVSALSKGTIPVSFSASGPQPSGLPWSAVQRSIPKNILLQASNNPSTLEELAMELGIALPYMEEEVELLHKATLLEKNDDKYITNFFILNKECRLDIYNALRRCSKERSRLLKELLTDILPDIRSLKIAGDTIDDNSIYWWLVPYSIDHFLVQTARSSKEKSCEPPRRANGEEWGFVGYEHMELPENTSISHDGNGNKTCCFVQYRYPDYSLWNRCVNPSYEVSLLLGDCITENRRFNSFSNRELELWSTMDGKIAHMDDNGNIIPDILVITKKAEKGIKKKMEEQKNYTALLRYFQETYEEVKSIFKGYSHKILHDHIGYNILMEMYNTRMMAVHDLVETDFLKVPENPDTSTVGMYLWLQ